MERVTMADVAREAGVSKKTVSRVLNGGSETSQATILKVQEVIDRLSYRPSSIARGLATNRTQTLGLVVPDITNPFFPEVARGVEDTAWEQGYNIFLCNFVEDPKREEAILRLLGDKQVDGVIICSPRLPDRQLLPLLEWHHATVVVNRSVTRKIAGLVRVDDALGAEKAVNHLLAGGRSTIGFLGVPLGSYSGQERLRGYVTALRLSGSAVNPEHIMNCHPHFEDGYRTTYTLLSTHPEINGLICHDDLIAAGALRACAELGLQVPQDVAIVGHDDVLLAQLVTPRLTTLRVSQYDIGANAVRVLLDRIAGRSQQVEIILKPELVIRESAP